MKAATNHTHDQLQHSIISIHAAREGGDLSFVLHSRTSATFQSTPPVKAATVFTEGTDIPLIISIHAAREGGD